MLCEYKPLWEATSATLSHSGITISFTHYTRWCLDHSDFPLYWTCCWIEFLTWSQMSHSQGLSYKHLHWFLWLLPQVKRTQIPHSFFWKRGMLSKPYICHVWRKSCWRKDTNANIFSQSSLMATQHVSLPTPTSSYPYSPNPPSINGLTSFAIL